MAEKIVIAIFYGIGWCFMALLQFLWHLVRRGIWSWKRSHPQDYTFPLQSRFEHTHIIGGSGHGKTQLLQELILKDLEHVAQGNHSVVVFDSQGDMVRKFLHFKLLAPVHGFSTRVVLIDPTDIENPPCLNLFDFGLDRVKGYSPLERETILNGAISLYEYIFGALLGAELTNRQGVIFRYIARLLMQVPGATIYTLLDFMESPELVRPYLPKLDLQTQRFFTTQFLSSAYDNTRQQIAARLWGVLSNTTLAQMFAHSHNKLNLFEAMNDGSLILINTAKDLLKDKSEIFGRFMIALVNQATQERAALAANQRKPTFVYIDEAADYLDEKMEELLNQARKYNVGITIAHQNLGQFSRSMQQTVMASTSIKFAGGVSDDDARALAKEMRCKPEFIQMMQKGAKDTRFAVFVRNVMTEPAEYVVPLGLLESEPTMSKEEYEAFLVENRKRYSAPYDQKLIASSVALTNAGVTFDLAEPSTL
jgi:Type IV secretion-system coupling protein DNA-binding domain/TraM recognition site of TraD and TraG